MADAADSPAEAPPLPDAPRIRLLQRRGAVLAAGADRAVPAHYGAPLREQRRLLRGSAVVDAGHLELLEVAGPDAFSWLTTISTQVLTGAPVGASLTLAVLSPQGRLEHLAAVAITAPDTALLITDPGARSPLLRYLEMMRFAARVELTCRDDLRALGSTRPPADVLAAAGVALPVPEATWTDPWPAVAPGGVAYGPDPEDATAWVLSVWPAAALTAIDWPADLLAGLDAAEALRVASHRPRLITESDARTIPHELDLLRTAVHTQKGCYRGQETVAKVLNLGQPPRRLVMLHLDGSQDVPVRAGAEVRMGGPEGRAVGTVTTAALHADLGPIALAVVKRAVPLEERLVVQALLGAQDSADEGQGEGEALWLDAAQEAIVLPRDHGERPPTARL